MGKNTRTPLNQTKKGTATLVSCLVETLGETDPTFRQRFVHRLSRTYGEIRGASDSDCLDMLSLVKEMLRDDEPDPPVAYGRMPARRNESFGADNEAEANG